MSIFNILKNYYYDVKYISNRIAYGRKLGAEIGENCKILVNPRRAFGSEPYLITIGNHVEITDGVRFITHDGGAWVSRSFKPNAAVYGKIHIGNNVFIGLNSIILPNVTIGDNCVVGAGSIVTKSISPNSVVAGVPAKYIKSYDEYIESICENSVDILNFTYDEKKKFLIKKYPEWFEDR